MIIREALIKIKSALHLLPEELFVGLVVVLVGTASFGLGRLSVESGASLAKSPVQIVYPEDAKLASGRGRESTAAAAAAVKPSGEVVVSKNGSKYHFLWCPGAKSISEQNRFTFESAAAAESAGYTLAANCK